MTTFAALTTLPGQPGAEALAEALERLEPAPLGVGVFEVEDGSGLWEVGAYFEPAPPPPGVLDLLALAFGARPFALSEVPDIDWVAKVRRELAPVEAGRFFIYGAHDADKVPQGRIGLQIEATVAFGTGHHGTTLGCLLAFDAALYEGFAPKRVADIGCGTGILALAAAAALPGAKIVAGDLDAVAVEVSKANLPVNDLVGRIEIVEAAGFDHPAFAAAAPFDLVFANILKGPLIDLAPSVAAHLAPGGRAFLSGLLRDQAEAVGAAYTKAGLALRAKRELGDWCVIECEKIVQSV